MKLIKKLFISLFNQIPYQAQVKLRALGFINKRLLFDFESTFLKLELNKKCKLIVIGANDGVSFDNLFQKLNPDKTIGLVIEPSPYYFELLKKNLDAFKKLTFLNYALFKESKMVSLYQLNKKGLVKLPDWGRGIGSFAKEHLMKFGIEENDLEELNVIGKSFTEIINDFPEFMNIDYLQIDTEGYDAEIIKMIDFHKFQTKLIKFESINLKNDELTELKLIFKNAGYQFFKGKEDSYALHQSVKPKYK